MRVFVDDRGTEWTAWEVHPSRAGWHGQERRSGIDRRATAARATAPDERRRGPDRRLQTLRAVRTLGAVLAGGWLAFQAGTTRRRLTPIPPGWERLDDAELAALCRQAPSSQAVAPLFRVDAGAV